MKNPEKEAAKWRKTLTNLAAKHDEAAINLETLKERKRGLVLKAHGAGHEASRDKLVGLNRSAASASLELDDIRDAIRQAEQQLEAAEAAIAEAQEAARLKNLSAACEAIIKAAEAVDEKGKAMMSEVAAYTAAFDTARQLVNGNDHEIIKHLNARRHLHLYLGNLTGLERNPRDSRSGRGLAHLDRETLARFILSDTAIKRLVAQTAQPPESNVVDIEQQKAATAA